jgi:hypothetical protein
VTYTSAGGRARVTLRSRIETLRRNTGRMRSYRIPYPSFCDAVTEVTPQFSTILKSLPSLVQYSNRQQILQNVINSQRFHFPIFESLSCKHSLRQSFGCHELWFKINGMIFINCDSVFTQWQWSVNLYVNRKKTTKCMKRKNTIT